MSANSRASAVPSHAQPERARLHAAALESIVAGARAALPAECCGLLLSGGAEITGAAPVRNSASRADAFGLDPLDFARAERAARRAGFRVCGYYHSHPAGDLAPSAADRSGTLWADAGPALHLIVGPAGQCRLWRARPGGWQPVPVELVGAETPS